MTTLLKLEQKIESSIRSTMLLNRGEHVAVAVSGGPDSVALLTILVSLKLSLGIKVSAIHLDHGLRGNQSDEDAQFVRCLCDQFHIDLIMKKLGLKKLMARQNGLSLQEYARNARYETLIDVANRMDATKVALGHTGDDQVETVLMWMIRGAGTRGLGGIPLTREPFFVRPILGVSRSEVLDYLEIRKMTYCVDHTNLQPMYLRNRIRQELVPLLKRYNPNLVNVLSRQADIVREEDSFLDQLTRESIEECKLMTTDNSLVLDRTRLLSLPVTLRRRVVRLAIQQMANMTQSPRFDSVETVLDRVIQGQSGVWVNFNGIRIGREYNAILFQKAILETNSSVMKDVVSRMVTVPSHVIWPPTGQTLQITLEESFTGLSLSLPHQVVLDAATFTRPLTVRTWQSGDQFYPLGLSGKRKKLQDFFSDIKLEGSRRAQVPLLVAPEGILWVGGYRLDHRFRVTKSTRQVLTVSLSPGVH